MAKKIKKSKKVTKKSKVRKPGEWESRKPVLKFAGTFFLACILFYILTNMSWFSSFRAPILDLYSSISAGILNIFGFGVDARGSLLSSTSFSVSIEEGCDAIAPAILYAISVLIFPIAWSLRWKGFLFGLLAIAILNIIRIISLYLIGVYVPSLFEFMHVEFWQAVFIVFTVGLWIYWMRWSTNSLTQTA